MHQDCVLRATADAPLRSERGAAKIFMPAVVAHEKGFTHAAA